MKRILSSLAILAAGPVIAAPGGPIDTLQLGTYACELPGDATGPAGVRVAEQDFEVINASSYTAQGARGSYLLTGRDVVMTSGPKQGQRFVRISASFVRLAEADGSPGALRCIRRVTNNR